MFLCFTSPFKVWSEQSSAQGSQLLHTCETLAGKLSKIMHILRNPCAPSTWDASPLLSKLMFPDSNIHYK